MDIRQLLITAHDTMSKEKVTNEAAKPPSYRIGSSGCVDSNGNIHGNCHRKTHARAIGKESPASFQSQIMFAAGEANEDTWLSRLSKSGYQGKILRHADCLIHEYIPGVEWPLEGHPDIVLADEEGVPTLGIELKAVLGGSTAVSVELAGKPKNDNLIQAAAYSMMLNIPYVLAYTCANYTPVNYYDQKTYGVKTILPFYRLFYLRWDGDTLQYRDERKVDWVSTLITKEGIRDYYRLQDEMRNNKDLGPRPAEINVDGSPVKWSSCGLCEYREACDKYDEDKSYDNWVKYLGGLR